jgi:predicted XRE-type DNA-binding protein
MTAKEVKIKVNLEAFQTWLDGAGISQTEFAKQEGIDDGNFSKMLNNDDVQEVSKPVMKKMCLRTGYELGRLFFVEVN